MIKHWLTFLLSQPSFPKDQLTRPKYATKSIFQLINYTNPLNVTSWRATKQWAMYDVYKGYHLHFMGDAFSFWQNFRHGFGTQYISQCSRSQQLSGSKGIINVTHRHNGVKDPVIYHSIYRHRHRILSQNLENKSKFLSTWYLHY